MATDSTIDDVLTGRAKWCVVTGDCLDVLRTIPAGSVDAVVTDPPYGIGWEYATHEDSFANWVRLVDNGLPEMRRVSSGPVALAVGPIEAEQHIYAKHAPTWRMCWYRGSTGARCAIGFRDWETIFVWGTPPTPCHDYFQAQPEQFKHGHTCPKPFRWAKLMVERMCAESGLVIDPFCGSGTTGVGCVMTGRRFIGIEIDPAYAAIARRRISEAANHLFQSTGA